MTKLKALSVGVLLAFAIGAPQNDAVAMTVIDPTNLAQNVAQVSKAVQQIQELQAQLEQARQIYGKAKEQVDAITGGRGMEMLLNQAVRDYIPADAHDVWNLVESLEDIRASVDAIKEQQGLWSANSMEWNDGVAAGLRQSYSDDADLIAAGIAEAESIHNALEDRFDNIDELVQKIGDADDAKAIADLNARISAENAFLQSEVLRMQSMMLLIEQKEKAQSAQYRQRMLNAYGGSYSAEE